MKKLLLYINVIALMIIAIDVWGQNESNIWYFGNHAGIDFNSGSPVAITNGGMMTYDNASAICDSAGNLLFYTDGQMVWNANHQIMSNGVNIGGSTTGGQAAVIVKKPLSNSIYYIFTSDGFGASGGLEYSIVDMSLLGGLGEVTQLGTLLQIPSTEKLAGIHTCTEKFTWLITHRGNSNEFCSYKITQSGLDTVPVVSAIGTFIPAGPYGVVNSTAGQMSLSKDGSKLASVNYQSGTVEIFDFNVASGHITNQILLTNTYLHAWGVEFSADASKLYLSVYNSPSILQFDLSSGNATTITGSEISIGNITGTYCPGFSGATGYLQRGPDDKIYLAKCGSTYISVINSPNDAGTLCGFVDNGIYLNSKVSTFGLSRSIAHECESTGLKSVDKNELFSVTPNPSNGSFSINFSENNFRGIRVLKIFNSMGEVVYFEKVVYSQTKEINTNLAAGIYTLELNLENQSVFKKIVVY
ncbi:MAG: T9SS type A sorting domain-containing protein [Bacteroidota bacterium]